jgi:hypothetical protein
VARRRTALLVAGIGLSPLGLVSAPATAHPSDFATLTLDLLIGPDGVEAIDAAVVESAGPIYQPFPTSELKLAVATDVLEALHVPLDQVDIDAETSERYHEVGFLVRFHEPSLGTEMPLWFNTTDLQRIAADRDLSRLKLSVCGITAGNNGASQSTLSRLDIHASQPGQPVTGPDRGLDRPACSAWALTTTDQPVSIVINPRRSGTTSTAVPSDPTDQTVATAINPPATHTGTGVVGVLIVALAVVLSGVVFLFALIARTRPQQRP